MSDSTPALVRPMRPADLADAERLCAESFQELDLRTFQRGWPDPEPRSGARSARWIERTGVLLATDPGGCWVSEDPDGTMTGFATSFVRDTTWCLATYAVRPGLQGRGIGKPLLEAAMTHGRHCLRGMLSASVDPKAVRRYRLAGFSLHPQMFLRGTVDRATIPVVEKVREGGLGDRDLLDSVDRAARGAARTPAPSSMPGVDRPSDHDLLARMGRLLVSDTSTGQGYVYCGDSGVAALAAGNRHTAERLLWAALADTSGPVEVNHVTAANEWAIDVGMAARLDLHPRGYLALRGMAPPSPYLHNGALL